MFLLQAAQRLSEALAQATTIEEGEKVVTQSIFVEFTFDTQLINLVPIFKEGQTVVFSHKGLK